ncbi:Zinc finger, Sec23/Sec24-type, partial [Trema orientale]
NNIQNQLPKWKKKKFHTGKDYEIWAIRIYEHHCILCNLISPLVPVAVFFVIDFVATSSVVDFVAKIWICRFCFHRNQLPHQYTSISIDDLKVLKKQKIKEGDSVLHQIFQHIKQ